MKIPQLRFLIHERMYHVIYQQEFPWGSNDFQKGESRGQRGGVETNGHQLMGVSPLYAFSLNNCLSPRA